MTKMANYFTATATFNDGTSIRATASTSKNIYTFAVASRDTAERVLAATEERIEVWEHYRKKAIEAGDTADLARCEAKLAEFRAILANPAPGAWAASFHISREHAEREMNNRRARLRDGVEMVIIPVEQIDKATFTAINKGR
jgi:hypothetical protein